MDHRRDVQQFLTRMRARLTPEQAGVPVFGGDRRVPGLRREEAAQLAAITTDTLSSTAPGPAGPPSPCARSSPGPVR